MKKMAGMQMHTVNDPMNREILKRQIVSWDENLEKLLIEQYQLRCYLSALEGSGLPCAKVKKLYQTNNRIKRSIGQDNQNVLPYLQA